MLALLLTGCAGKPPPPPKAIGVYKVGEPYQVAGVWYYPREQPDYDETGIASWYGPGFHGKATANGETYDMNALTAAHKTLPLPVNVRVTNLDNGRSIVLKINDRGPFVNGRIIDVSRRGAQLLGFGEAGTAPVRVQIQDSGGGKAGTFVAAKPQTSAEEKTLVAAAPSSGVSSQVLPGSIVDSKVKPAPRGSGPPAPFEIASQPAAPSGQAAEPQVEFRPVPAVRNIFVQAGAFIDLQNAESLRRRLLRAEPGFQISAKVIDGKSFYRVRTGPLASVEIADATLARVIAAGQPSAQIIVD
ncbi:MAG: septal ring lytic transglycosylase RlpA family protein [Alphaproteobacteria bacterium]